MAETTSVFGNLYDYSSSKGIVLPQTADVKAKIVEGFNEIFGQDISTDETTPIGRFVEALTLLFINVLGTNAQNANFLNPEQAVGKAIDNLGSLFGIVRGSMNDDDYRNLIMTAQSRGYGFAESIRRAVASVEGVTTVSVLNNGEADPCVLPNEEAGALVAPHSVLICVDGGDDDAIAAAINNTISAGCGMVQEGFAEDKAVSKTITDADTGTSSNIVFYRPSQVYARFTVSIRVDAYTGADAIGDTQSAIKAYVSSHNSGHRITEADIITAVGVAGLGLVCTSVKIEARDSEGTWTEIESLTIRPNEYVDTDDESMTIAVDIL